MNLFESQLFAQATEQAAKQEPSAFELVFPFIMIFVLIYFFFIRPQSKRFRDQQSMVSALKTGDEVVTSGGLIGKVKSIADSFVTLEFSAGNTVKVLKANVASTTKDKPKAAPATKKVEKKSNKA